MSKIFDLPIFDENLARQKFTTLDERSRPTSLVPNYLSYVEQAVGWWPDDWRNSGHNTNWIRKLVSYLNYEVDPNVMLNGKGLSETNISRDGLGIFSPGSPIVDIVTGKDFAFIDVIVGHDGPNPRPAWQNISGTTRSQGRLIFPARVHDGIVIPPPPPPPPLIRLDRGEFFMELISLDEFYSSQEGLQRKQGLSVGPGKPDFEGIAAWIFDIYLNARLDGKSPSEARALYIAEIKKSDEWKKIHPVS